VTAQVNIVKKKITVKDSLKFGDNTYITTFPDVFGTKTMYDDTVDSLFSVVVDTMEIVMGEVYYMMTSQDSDTFQVNIGTIDYITINDSGTFRDSIMYDTSVYRTAGSMPVTWNIVHGVESAIITVSADARNYTPQLMKITFTINSRKKITKL
jgi:hypothetical protein